MKPKALILAGGVGKRFFPMTVNKVLLPMCGKPLVEHTLDQLARVGFEEVLITVNEFNKDFFESYDGRLSVTTKLQPEATGMADAVLLFEEELDHSPVVIMNAIDLVEDSLFEGLLARVEDSYAVVVGRKFDTYFPGGYLEVEGNRAISVVEKPGAENAPSDLVKLVFDYFSEPADFIGLLKDTTSEHDDVYERALFELMKEHEVSVEVYDGYWQALKYTFNVLDVVDVFLKQRVKRSIAEGVYIAESASIEGDVVIEPGARIFNNASVKGPAYIGRNAIVGDGALVRDSVVEEGAVVGFGSEVSRSYVGPKCMLHHNFVGDSILEAEVNPSWGTCYTNTRFDGETVKVMDKDGNLMDTKREKLGAIVAKGAFLGSNSTVLPGRIIGPGQTCRPGSVIEKNLI